MGYKLSLANLVLVWLLLISSALADGGKAWFPIQPIQPGQDASGNSSSAKEFEEKIRRFESNRLQFFKSLPMTPVVPSQVDPVQQQARPQSGTGTIPQGRDALYYFQLGASIWRGDLGHPRDPAFAIELLKRSAQAGLPAAIYQLGLFYLNGSVVAKDEAAGTALINQAIQMGYKPMTYSLWQ